MAKKTIEVDTTKALEGFRNLTSKKQENINKAGLVRGGNMIKKTVQKNVNSTFKNKGIRFADMYNGVTVKYHKSSNSVKVSTMGNNKYHNSYILRFFGSSKEQGRKHQKYKGSSFKYNKYRKKTSPMGYKGVINKVNLFNNVDENKVYNTIDETVRRRLIKLYDKK